MHVPIGDTGWYLCDPEDEATGNFVDFRGREALVVQWLNQFRGDVFALRTMRRLLGVTHPWTSDGQVFAQVARRLTIGTWVARKPAFELTPVSGTSEPGEAAPFPIEERRSAPSPSSSSAPDPPVFPGDIDPAAIAQAQKDAAAAGVPFCEECLRAQLAGQ